MPRKVIDAGLVDELKIDKDAVVDREWITDYTKLAITTCRQHGVEVVNIKMCPSRRKGIHFYIRITPAIKSELANRLQFLLGDDCQRVDFNRARIEVGFKEWNKLFESARCRLQTIYRGTPSRRVSSLKRPFPSAGMRHEHKANRHRGEA